MVANVSTLTFIKERVLSAATEGDVAVGLYVAGLNL